MKQKYSYIYIILFLSIPLDTLIKIECSSIDIIFNDLINHINKML